MIKNTTTKKSKKETKQTNVNRKKNKNLKPNITSSMTNITKQYHTKVNNSK